MFADDSDITPQTIRINVKHRFLPLKPIPSNSAVNARRICHPPPSPLSLRTGEVWLAARTALKSV